MKFKLAMFALVAGLMSAPAFAEDRAQVGYYVGETVTDAWTVSVEKNLFDVGPATVYAEGSAIRLDGIDNTNAAAGAGVQFNLTDNLVGKIGVVHNFAEQAEDFVTYKAGLVYTDAAWRFSGSLLKSDSVDVVAELTAERKVAHNFGLGVGALFDEHDYIATQAFVSYTF